MRAGFSGGQHYDDERPNFGVFGIPYWCGDGAVLYLGDSQAILGSKLHERIEVATIIEFGATARRPAPLSLIEKGATAT